MSKAYKPKSGLHSDLILSVLIAQLCPALCDPMDGSPWGGSPMDGSLEAPLSMGFPRQE